MRELNWRRLIFVVFAGWSLMNLSAGNVLAGTQRYVQIDVRVTGGNPDGLESGGRLDGELIMAWDTGLGDPLVKAPDPKLCVENNGEFICTSGDCPNTFFCSFIGVPIPADKFQLQIWDADDNIFVDNADDLIVEGECAVNTTCRSKIAEVVVTEVPCPDPDIQVRFYPIANDSERGRYLVGSGYERYPSIQAGHHEYKRTGKICKIARKGCDLDLVFSMMTSRIKYLAPVQDQKDYNPVVSCKENILEGNNPVRTYIDAKNLTIVNFTLPKHTFHPGKITRRVISSDGWIVVETEGEGVGNWAIFNIVFGEAIFAGIDDKLSMAIHEVLSISEIKQLNAKKVSESKLPTAEKAARKTNKPAGKKTVRKRR